MVDSSAGDYRIYRDPRSIDERIGFENIAYVYEGNSSLILCYAGKVYTFVSPTKKPSEVGRPTRGDLIFLIEDLTNKEGEIEIITSRAAKRILKGY